MSLTYKDRRRFQTHNYYGPLSSLYDSHTTFIEREYPIRHVRTCRLSFVTYSILESHIQEMCAMSLLVNYN